mgnify:CR=1 FL=1
MRYVVYADRKAVAAALIPVYTAVDVDAALAALAAFADSHLGQEVPGRGSDLGERLGPVHPVPGLRSRDSEGDLHRQQHRVVELPAAQDHPGTAARALNDAAVVKLLWLAIRSIEEKRAHQRATQTGTPRAQRKAPGKLVEGFTIQGWVRVLNELAIRYPERFLQTN